MKTKTFSILCAILMMLMITSPVLAASYEVSNTTKTALAKMIQSADTAQAKKITTSFDEFMSIQKDNEKWDDLIKSLNNNNDADLSTIKKQIKDVNKDKLSQLEAQVNQAKEKLKPLNTLSKSLSNQITASKKLKNKNLTTILQIQADSVKFAIQIARVDIDMKEKKLKTVKDETSKKVQSIRNTLANIDPIKVHIKTKKTAISDLNKQVSTEWSGFIQTVKKGTPKTTFESLASLAALSRKINDHKKAIHQYEKQINSVILKAKSQL
jgi:hypothetical protein